MENLQLGEDAGVELAEPVVPQVQLGHVSEQVRLIWDHAGDLIQPDKSGAKAELHQCTSSGV